MGCGSKMSISNSCYLDQSLSQLSTAKIDDATIKDDKWVRFCSGPKLTEEGKGSHPTKEKNLMKSPACVHEYLLTRRIDFVRLDITDSLYGSHQLDTNTITRKLDNREIYHLKRIDDFFLCCGEGKEEQSICRLLNITTKLTEISSFCLPIALRLKIYPCGEERIRKCDAIVFEKLADYSIGLPMDPIDRKQLVKEIESVVAEMHNLGVVHMDLCLSNLMWKKNDDDCGGSFDVRIIDFDAAHRLGERITDSAWNALHYGNVPDFCRLGSKATKEHDTLYLDMIKHNIDDIKLQVKVVPDENEYDVKERLDTICSELMTDYLYTLACIEYW